MDGSPEIRIGTRKSALAQVQARWVAAQLEAQGVKTRLVLVESQGDLDRSKPLYDSVPANAPGLFTKVLEDALLANTVDVAVHSLKDLPTQSPAGLSISAVPPREVPDDCLLVRDDRYDGSRPFGLPEGAVVGTSSLRREALLLDAVPGLQVVSLRGNVPTRVDKARSGNLDAVVLASAGLRRLALSTDGLVALPLPPDRFVPAPGQGALAVQTRSDIAEPFTSAIRSLHDTTAGVTTSIERAVLRAVEGGCTVPLGVWCVPEGDRFRVRAFLGLLVGDKAVLPHRWHSFHRFERLVRDEATALEEVAKPLRAIWDAFRELGS